MYHCLLRANVMSGRIRQSLILTYSNFPALKCCLYPSNTIFQKNKDSFQPPLQEIWLAKLFPEFDSFKNMEFQKTIYYIAQQITCFFYNFCVLGMVV